MKDETFVCSKGLLWKVQESKKFRLTVAAAETRIGAKSARLRSC
jgi:hypothetical protein